MAHRVDRIPCMSTIAADMYAGPMGELICDESLSELILENGTRGGIRIASKQYVKETIESIQIPASAAYPSPSDFGAVGDGITDDTAAFIAFENQYQGYVVNLGMKSYKVTSLPYKNTYFNGTFVHSFTGFDKKIHNLKVNIWMPENLDDRTNLGVLFGDLPKPWYTGNPAQAHDIFIASPQAFRHATPGSSFYDVIAIGARTLENGTPGNHVLALGDGALRNLNGGDRDIAIGSYAMYFAEKTTRSIAIGRDAGHCLVEGDCNVLIGYGAASGGAPVGLSGEVENHAYQIFRNNVVIGMRAAHKLSGTTANNFNTIVGYHAAYHGKDGYDNVYLGANVCTYTGENAAVGTSSGSINKVVRLAGDGDTIINASYTVNPTTITVNMSGSGNSAIAGKRAAINFRKSDGSWTGQLVLPILSVSGTSFVLQTSNNKTLTGTGSACVSWFETNEAYDTNFRNVLVGSSVLTYADHVERSVVIGGWGMQYTQDAAKSTPQKVNLLVAIGSNVMQNTADAATTVCIGSFAGANISKVASSVLIGSGSGGTGNMGALNVYIGYEAGKGITSDNDENLYGNTAVGAYAMKQDNTGAGKWYRSAALGYNAQVTGSNQIQLGGTGTDVYAYSGINIRSDVRDKTDIRDTEFGLDFIRRLRPVDFKWDLRDSYVNERGQKFNHDGSRKGHRYHHGLIAQELKQVLTDIQSDFGGYQDHKINGGGDVLTINYSEFIAPLIKAVQELAARIDALEKCAGI